MKNEIIENIIPLVARKGFSAASIAEIAKVAGVSQPTIYAHFRTKDELLLSLFEQGCKKLNNKIEQNFKRTEDFWERFKLQFDIIVDFIKKNPAFSIIMVRESLLMRRGLGAKLLKREWFKPVRSLIKFFNEAYKERENMEESLRGKVRTELLLTAIDFIRDAWDFEWDVNSFRVKDFLNLLRKGRL